MRVVATVVLVAVTVSALWCVDGCGTPWDYSSAASQSAPLDSTDGAKVPCICALPFQGEPAMSLTPQWRSRVTLSRFTPADPPIAPIFGVFHPPRTA